ncbi:MAG: T9SS type A sorting domain-containing protein, partial [Bacteroidota bacterium]|nr:T9SS type A sorting domain-containing protein [Bacteroidota bacterium]
YSGMNCWDVNLNSAYSNYAVCYLSSPIFDFSLVAQAHISFWTMYRAEYLWDYMSVQYSVDKGDSWEFMPFPNLINPDGYVEKWIKSELHVNNLYGYGAVQFRFIFVSDNSIALDGYSIDDFRIDIDALSTPDLNSGDAFSFYPNPSNGSVNFSFKNSNYIQAQITVYDATGKIILTQPITNLPNNSLSLSNLNQGTYSVVYNDADAVIVKKLVVVH